MFTIAIIPAENWTVLRKGKFVNISLDAAIFLGIPVKVTYRNDGTLLLSCKKKP